VRLVGELKKTKKEGIKEGMKKERKKTPNLPKAAANWLFAQTTHVIESKSNFAWCVACGVVIAHSHGSKGL